MMDLSQNINKAQAHIQYNTVKFGENLYKIGKKIIILMQ
jgi:hypothetical protein